MYSRFYRNLRQMANFTAKVDFEKCFNNGLMAITRAIFSKLKVIFQASLWFPCLEKT